MKHRASSLIALAFASVAIQAQAQDASAPPADQSAPPATPAPSTDAQPAPGAAAPAAPAASAGATAQVSDTEVDHFAKATVAVQKINADAKLDEKTKQTQMAAAVKASGLEPARYNEIGKALSSDPALLAKVKTAMAKYAGPSQG